MCRKVDILFFLKTTTNFMWVQEYEFLKHGYRFWEEDVIVEIVWLFISLILWKPLGTGISKSLMDGMKIKPSAILGNFKGKPETRIVNVAHSGHLSLDFIFRALYTTYILV